MASMFFMTRMWEEYMPISNIVLADFYHHVPRITYTWEKPA